MMTIQEIEGNVAGLFERQTISDAQIRELYGDNANSRRMATNLTDEVSVLTGRVDGIGVWISELKGVNDTTDKALENLTAQFNQLIAVNGSLNRMNADLGKLRCRHDNNYVEIIHLKNQVINAEDRADVAMDHVEMLEGKMEKLERTVRVQRENIELLTHIAEHNRYAKQDTDSTINDLKDRITELERDAAAKYRV